jgi:hypothetical protein
MGWVTFCANFSQTQWVTLCARRTEATRTEGFEAWVNIQKRLVRLATFKIVSLRNSFVK